MPHYLLQVAYTPEAWATMVKNPQNREDAVRPAVEKLGGRFESFYLAFGDYDVVAVCEFPDNASAADEESDGDVRADRLGQRFTHPQHRR